MSSKIPTNDQFQTLSDLLQEKHCKLWSIVERTDWIQELIELEEDCQRAQKIISQRLSELQGLLQNERLDQSKAESYFGNLT